MSKFLLPLLLVSVTIALGLKLYYKRQERILIEQRMKDKARKRSAEAQEYMQQYQARLQYLERQRYLREHVLDQHNQAGSKNFSDVPGRVIQETANAVGNVVVGAAKVGGHIIFGTAKLGGSILKGVAGIAFFMALNNEDNNGTYVESYSNFTIHE
jgi:CRISPR/Cas system CMR subunit Cmr6 (Cas7 group RAMP superfamily)